MLIKSKKSRDNISTDSESESASRGKRPKSILKNKSSESVDSKKNKSYYLPHESEQIQS